MIDIGYDLLKNGWRKLSMCMAIWFWISVLMISCSSNEKDGKLQTIDKSFFGMWAETEWTYIFRKDGLFIFESKGYYGNTREMGSYFIVDSSIYLTPNSDWLLLDGVLKTKLKIIDEHCIRDVDNNFYCQEFEDSDKRTHAEYEFQQYAISIMDSLNCVMDCKEEMIDHKDFKDAKIEYDRIFMINKEEFHKFDLVRYELNGYSQWLRLLVRKNPFEIYYYKFNGELKLVYSMKKK